MAEESGTAVLDAPASPAADSSNSDAVPVEGSVPAPATERTSAPEPPVAPQREARPTPTPVRDARQPEPAVTPPPAEHSEESLLDWHELIPADVRGEKSWEKYKSVGEALKSLVNQEKLLGEMIRVPKAGASDGQMRAFYERLGCPKHAGDYVITDPDLGQDADGTPQTLDADFLTSLLEQAHQAGMTNTQAQQWVDYAARQAVRARNIQAGEVATQRAQTERDLYDAFGGDTPAMIEKARMFVINMGSGRYGGGDYATRLADKLKAGPMANDIDLIATFANGWDNFREGIWVGDDSHGSMTSLETMDADIAALNAQVNDESKSMEDRKRALAIVLDKQRERNKVAEANANRQQTMRR